MSLTAAAVALMIGSALPEAGEVSQASEVASVQPVPAPASSDGPSVAVPAPVADPVTLPTFDSVVIPLDTAGAEQGGAQSVADQSIVAQSLKAAENAPAPVDAPDAAPEAPPTDNGVPTTTGADIVVTHRRRPPPGDPLERINEQSFTVVQSVDKAIVEPVAKVYNKGLPRPVREGLRNFFSNLREPVVFVAYMLELKPGKAFETAGRFAINTTLGVAGVMDIAKRKPFHLPYRPNGLSDVLGYYGVGPGPFMYLPLIGPTTVRDLIGDTVDNLASPTLLGKPFTKPEVAIPMLVMNRLGERAAFDEEINRIRKDEKPYATYRELYLRQRKAEIEALHGRVLPDVVPVYGRAMPTAGGKKDDKDGAKETDGIQDLTPSTEGAPEGTGVQPLEQAPGTDASPATAPVSVAPEAPETPETAPQVAPEPVATFEPQSAVTATP